VYWSSVADAGESTPADDARFRELSGVLRGLTEKLGLETATEEWHGPDAIPGLTSWSGHLPLELGDLIGETWQESASGW
jgi:hypothetical protein